MNRYRHKKEDGSPKFTNRLLEETSPYLLGHAHNPVDWHPWGDEAFDQARREDKPVLLSIGYSSCHWCHVMEEKSFEDLEIAEYLNAHYISIKVDREERPDLDGLYMAAVQRITGGGGWPMTVWLTPDRKPYFGGTYFPPRDGDRGARMGFLTLLSRLCEVYRTKRDEVETQSEQLVEAIRVEVTQGDRSEIPGKETFGHFFSWAENSFDSEQGGFGAAPKFPRPAVLQALLRYGQRTGNKTAIEMVKKTLFAMAEGGMYDQVGGGFHRYSVDAAWLVPHFEKMLYDNAQLVWAYLEAYQVTHEPFFAKIARETLDYVAREMTSPQGGFYSATDADSEGEEGTFFVWSKQEIMDLLGEEDGRFFCQTYGVTEEGNFEGKNIPFLSKPRQESAQLERVRKKLYEARKKRVPPLTDDKILTSWNGLMIAAFAKGGFVLKESRYTEQAIRAASFLLENVQKDGCLLRSCRNGKAKVGGFLDDYAFFTAGLLDLFEATGEVRWFNEAKRFTDQLIDRFWDSKGDGFFLTSSEHEKLPTREKPYYDGAEPSGNAVAALTLLRMESFTSEVVYGDRGRRIFQIFGEVVEQIPHAVPFLLCALDYQLDEAMEIVLVDSQGGSALSDLLRRTYLPNAVRVVATNEVIGSVAEVIPLVKGRVGVDGKPTAHVCRKQVCGLSLTDVKKLEEEISR